MTKLSDIMTPKLISKNITAAIRRSSTGLPSIANCFLYKASELRNIRRNSFQMLRTKIARLYINRKNVLRVWIKNFLTKCDRFCLAHKLSLKMKGTLILFFSFVLKIIITKCDNLYS